MFKGDYSLAQNIITEHFNQNSDSKQNGSHEMINHLPVKHPKDVIFLVASFMFLIK